VSISVATLGRTAVMAQVIVVPAGTYRVTGAITHQGFPVHGAEVEVVRGPATGLTTIGNGTYSLYGVVGDSEIRVRKDGYAVGVRRTTVTRHQSLDFSLALRRGPENAAGTYTLRVSASDACRGTLPPEAWDRMYQATVMQDGSRLTVQLDGATFHTEAGRQLNTFDGVVQPDGVRFSVAGVWWFYYWGYYPDVVERLSPSSFYSFSGDVTATMTPGGITGLLRGEIVIFGGPPLWATVSTCRADHSIALAQ
jgi:hypothetical protein